ncbi:TATA-binding protein-interacting protein [Phaffia rhodozyma]|uniref:TATA-binding protein-interacting protein n=1 Tax=Phaffia rhodozyma TaxID=264483 RepID=A0A0F7SP96_PHARH|nr:TATA-binding protein-interacting protein [Phaffia rhodozyma]
MVYFHVQSLLEKANSDDPDLRFMALNDLISEASSPSFSVDEATETKLNEMVLKSMEDSNGEVKNAGVRAFAEISPKLRKAQLARVIDRLITMSSGAQSGKGEDLRDVASLALKTMTNNITSESPIAFTVIEKLPLKLLEQLDSALLPPQQTLETLDTLSDLFIKFRPLIITQIELQRESLRVLQGLLLSGRPAVKKKAIVTLGSLVPASTPAIFSSLTESLTNTLSSASSNSESEEVIRAYIQLVGTLARSSPQKTGGILKDVMGVILQSCELENGEEEDGREEDREAGLTTLESLILQCPKEIIPFTSSIADLAIRLISYDPNYAGADDEDDDEDMDDEEDDEDEDDEIEDDYDDDDDITWKTRRGAAKVLGALISTRSEILSSLYQDVLPVLITRISEREESVRLEIFGIISTLLRQTHVLGKGAPASTITKEIEEDGGMSPGTLKRKRAMRDDRGRKEDEDMIDAEDTPVEILVPQVNSLVKNVAKQLGTKSLITKQAGFTLLRELVTVLRGGLEAQAAVIFTRVSETLAITGSPLLSIETLSFLAQFFATHTLKVYQSSLPQLVKQIVVLTRDKSQKVSAEALVVSSELAKSLQSVSDGPLPVGLSVIIEQLYKASEAVLESNMADFEMRVKALNTLADLLCYEGDVLEAHYEASLGLVKTSIEKESLRLEAIKSAGRVARSGLCSGNIFESWLGEVLEIVSGLIRKGGRAIKIESFKTLQAVTNRLGGSAPDTSITNLIENMKPFIMETDLTYLPAVLDLLVVLLSISSSAKSTVEQTLLSQIISLVQSPSISGSSLEALLSFFTALIEVDQNLTEKVVPELVRISVGSSSAGAVQVGAQCVGAVVSASGRDPKGIVLQFAQNISSNTSSESAVVVSLLSLGEIGRATDLSAYSDVFKRVLELFNASTPEIRNSAAFAAGCFAVGASQYLQPILSKVETSSDKSDRLLSLQALREAIFHSSNLQLENLADSLWEPLFEDSENQAEESRIVNASCIGKLTTSNPAKYLPLLEAQIQSPSANIRATVASAIRYTFADTDVSYDGILAPFIVQFLSLMHDSDLTVRRVSLGSLNAAAQHKPQLIRTHLGTLLPLLYDETEIKQELIRVVQMGPWKQTFDDGLETRKTAFETMYTLLDTCLSQIDISTFLLKVVNGLTDADEIKVICFLSLTRLAHVAPASVIQVLDNISESFQETMKQFTGTKDTVKEDFDRKAEIQRSALRTIFQLSKLSSSSTPKFEEVVSLVKRGEFAREWTEMTRGG